MFDILVPKNHFLAANYPDMEDYILGLPIPIGWGNIHDIVPFCVDTDDLVFKIQDQHIQDITEIRSRGIPLSAGSYTPDLAVAEFTLSGTPFIVEGYVYYFAISGDNPINGTDYLTLITNTQNAGQQAYSINGADLWSAIAGRQLFFVIYGKERLDLDEKVILVSWGVPFGTVALRDAAARTRIGCSFTAPTAVRGSGYFVTNIRLYFLAPATGTPTGNIFVTLFRGINPDVQQGIQGDAIAISDPSVNIYNLTFPQEGLGSDLSCDVESPYPMLTNGADILDDLFTSILGKDPAILDAALLAQLRTKRNQELKIFIDREMNVGDFIGKMEASLLWKFLPLQDGTYGTIVFEPGTPAGTRHFRDEDFLSFRMERDLSVVRNIVRVKFDENPATQEFKIEEARSDMARLFYSNEESIEIETWLKDDPDALDLANAYSYFCQEPQVKVIFEVHATGLDLLPGRDKVLLTRSRAAWTGGSLSGKLFRIMRIIKRPITNTAEITAIPDERSIPPDFPPAESVSGSIPSAPPFSLGVVEEGTPGSGLHHLQWMDAATLAQISETPIPDGSGDNQSKNPMGIATDGTYFYVCDSGNHRILKHRISDGAFIWAVGSYGSGDDQFYTPWDICCDGIYLYITDRGNYRIKKHLCSTGAFVAKAGIHEYSPGNFIQLPSAIGTDGNCVWVTSTLPRIQVFTCDGLVYVNRLTTDAHLTGINSVLGLCVEGNEILFTNLNNGTTDSIFRFDKSSLAFISSYGAYGAGNTQFKGPQGIVSDGTYLYINDTANGRIKKHNLSDYAYVAQTGGILQPNGLCLVTP